MVDARPLRVLRRPKRGHVLETLSKPQTSQFVCVLFILSRLEAVVSVEFKVVAETALKLLEREDKDAYAHCCSL